MDQGSKIVLVRSYLRVSQVAGQVKILIFLMNFIFFPIYANNFCDAGQVPILKYFEACGCDQVTSTVTDTYSNFDNKIKRR